MSCITFQKNIWLVIKHFETNRLNARTKKQSSSKNLSRWILNFSIISKGEYIIRIGHSDWSKSSSYDTIIHSARAWLPSSPSLPSPQVNIADSCWMKFSFIQKTSLQVQDIWKDEDFSKGLLSPLDQKSFQEFVFKAFKSQTEWLHWPLTGQIDWLNFLQTKATHFEGIMTTVNGLHCKLAGQLALYLNTQYNIELSIWHHQWSHLHILSIFQT